MKRKEMSGTIARAVAGILGAAMMVWGVAAEGGVAVDFRTNIHDHLLIQYSPLGGEECVVKLDGAAILSSETEGEFMWQPQSLGKHTLELTAGEGGGIHWTKEVTVTGYDYFVQEEANPPMSEVVTLAITPVSASFGVGGESSAIVTSGSGEWTAATSDGWITLNTTNGTAGQPVAYTVAANNGAEGRLGYVYVGGYVHTVSQAGHGGRTEPGDLTAEHEGGTNGVRVSVQGRLGWHARPNADWISVQPTEGSGEATVTVQVAPWNDVSTRSGTLTIAGETVTVFQYGRRIKLSEYGSTNDYYANVIPLTVSALAITEWSVQPNASWISVVDGGSGRGSSGVSLAIGENPSWLERTGTVTIGTETYTIRQEGRTALEFGLSPEEADASRDGADGLVSVRATPDLPWTAASGTNWITLTPGFEAGAGNGNVAYTVTPNSTLADREGTITVTPGDSSLLPRTHRVRQRAAISAISTNGHEYAAAGSSAEVEVTVAYNVHWSVENPCEWLTVAGGASRVGPGSVTLTAKANGSVYPREGTLQIAGKEFRVKQKARRVEVEYEEILFKAAGGSSYFTVTPEENAEWRAVVSDPNRIVILENGSGTGTAVVRYVIPQYTGDGSPFNGTITIGDKVIYITQRPYDLTIEPNGEWVTGNAGQGEIGVSAGIGDIWDAIVTEPWITIITGYDHGTGSGTVLFTYAANDTGELRTGKIIIAGEVYTLTQARRELVAIGAAVEGHGGQVRGAGTYDLGTKLTLEAVADGGYEFQYWRLPGGGESMQNPLPVTADVEKNYTATFAALTPEILSALSDTNGVTLTWENLAWATEYRIYRGVADVPSTAQVVATVPADGWHSCLDGSGELETAYWYWVEAVGELDTTMSKDAAAGKKKKPVVLSAITYTNLMGTTHGNPSAYEEGTTMTFENPSALTGYTFAGWTPPQIGAETTGPVLVTANWDANRYRIAYDAQGGNGTMESTEATYDSAVELAKNVYRRAGYTFEGWAMRPDGTVAHGDGASVLNLSAEPGGLVTLYAVWAVLKVPAPVVTPGDGSVYVGETCEVKIECALEGAGIYYTTNGTTPKISERYLYTGPFAITGSATIKAVAEREGVKSDYVTVAIRQEEFSLENALDRPEGVSIRTGGAQGWVPSACAEALTGGLCARSGAIGDEEESWLELSVNGCGTLAFHCMTSCEADEDGTYSWDHLEVYVDGEEDTSMLMDGKTDWTQRRIDFGTGGAHSVRLVYRKDLSDRDGNDCAWADCVVWESTGAAMTEGGVPFAWLEAHGLATGGWSNAEAYEAAAARTAANGRNTVEECYVAGLDPTDAESGFRVYIVRNGGKTEITWIPELPEEEAEMRTYRVLGKESLTDEAGWVDVTGAEDWSEYRFFQVGVEMK